MTWEEFLTTKFGLWIDTRSSTDNTLHGSGRAVEKSVVLFQIEIDPLQVGQFDVALNFMTLLKGYKIFVVLFTH